MFPHGSPILWYNDNEFLHGLKYLILIIMTMFIKPRKELLYFADLDNFIFSTSNVS